MSETLGRRLPKPRNGAGRNVPTAIGVGVGLGALVVFSVWAGPLAWYLVVSVAIGVAMWEVLTRLREHSYYIPRTMLIILGQAMVWISWWMNAAGLVAVYVTAVLVLMFSRLFHNGRHRPPINYLRDTAVGIFVLTWIPLFGTFAAMLSHAETPFASGAASIVTFMLCVVASDTGGYITGVMFGSHPMAPAVSPKKSWEGFAGSIVFGVITGALAFKFLLHHDAWVGALMGLALVFCATLGDLVESQFKRELGIKDMSAILPAHGGLMDRLDGMLPSAMITWVAMSFLTTL
ncbi:phosphatidate cytidylyltransferase [Corynebacterium flavescens]|uniref:Phosphatidate cytidylyltransferase n=1 Tax=Corynebacterium flavescens TaxID=28028 RepID=A0AB73B9C2_CORFL|nr:MULTISPECIES: phosphatidate cytidylyltransferase [Corynebacterium]MDN6098973.1 phosphatidate cytidylyltransferase [Corynebacterium flavescens]MDN6199654.1 phosphatidate cytidylyltransferase [Corynebacterium flavescens]MDN6226497.1 phosphatidate cytidylyltransferase [Corynebacterium flavescens]MDN6236286.1 phosphatidate cytidylyltransferase [Corynebacterium flavescens]MDN6431197.1 phosphatidate cytidylyltransferase [Corynebacterium flavescens]